MSVTPVNVKALSPSGEFDELSDAYIQSKIDIASLLVNKSAWGKRYTAGLSNLAAHLLILGMQGGDGELSPSGEIMEASGAGLAIKYGSAAANDNDRVYASTPYGSVYLMLRKALVNTPLVTNAYTGSAVK